jgi:hypothetical protein
LWDPGHARIRLCQTLTEVIRLFGCAWPPGWFIHEFTAIMTMAPKMPLAAIGTPVQKCATVPARCE